MNIMLTGAKDSGVDLAVRAASLPFARLAALFLLAIPLAAQQQGPLTPRPSAGPDSPTAPAAPTAAQAAAPAPASAAPSFIEVPTGTKLPLILHNAITTRNAQPGDPVYLESTFPIVIDSHILVPAGSYVQGEIVDAKRPGKVKGTGEVRIRLTTLILPNGYTTKFDAVPTNAGTGGGESTDKEGQIKGDTDKTTDAGTVMKTTGVGAGIGAIAGRSAAGAGIGAGVGAAVGLAAVLLTRGPELELPRGTSVDVVLDRPLYLDSSKINFTDPGHSIALPGPSSREPVRSRSPL